MPNSSSFNSFLINHKYPNQLQMTISLYFAT